MMKLLIVLVALMGCHSDCDSFTKIEKCEVIILVDAGVTHDAVKP